MNQNRKNQIIRISIIAIAINTLLTALNMTAGIIDGSVALVSDAIHSFSDVIPALIVIVGAQIAAKNSETNPLRRERVESICCILLAFFLAVSGVAVGFHAVMSLIEGGSSISPSAFAIFAAAISIVIKEAMFFYMTSRAKRLSSAPLRAEAFHYHFDALSSAASLVGLIFALFGFVQADAIAGIIICAFLLKAAVDIFLESAKTIVNSGIMSKND